MHEKSEYEKSDFNIPNKLIALYGLAKCKERFTSGGLNRKDLFDQHREEFIPQLIILQKLRQQYVLISPDSEAIIQQHLKELRGGCCGELAAFTRQYIKERCPYACVELAELDHHTFVIIGRLEGSDPNDSDTWDNKGQTIVCDPWSKEIYPLNEFKNKQKNNLPIPMYIFSNQESILNDVHYQPILNDVHYLSGSPKIKASTIHYEQRQGNPNAHENSVGALIQIKKSENPKLDYDKAVKLYNAGDVDEASRLFYRALNGYKKAASSLKQQAHCYSGLASCCRDKSDYGQAMDCCNEAKALFSQCGLTEASPELSKFFTKLQGIESKKALALG